MIAIPCIIYIGIFFFGPLYGWLMAFVKYKPSRGIFGSEFMGLYYFKEFFTDPDLGKIVRNTLGMSSLNLITVNLFPIILALMINEVSHKVFKRTIQTLTYLPHFVSFVVVANIYLELLGTDGAVNDLLRNMSVVDTAYKFWQQPSLFWLLATFVRAWKEVGWGAIIYLASLAGIDQEQYEAAAIDGCGRIKRIFFITIPNLLPTVMVLWITNMSGLFSASFDASYMLGNATTNQMAEVIETYIYKMGLSMGMYSYSTAVSLIQTVLGFMLVYLTNKIAKKYVVLFRTYFMSVPGELLEAAKIDGAHDLKVFFKILMPVSKPIYATVGLYAAVTQWNSWRDTLYYTTNTSLRTLQFICMEMIKKAEGEKMIDRAAMFEIFHGEAVTADPLSLRMAITIITVVPIICVYPFLQKYFMKGIMVGSMKG